MSRSRVPRRLRSILPAIAIGVSAIFAAPAHAIDFKIKSEPLRLDLTESMFLSAHLDDGNPDPTTKNYGELVNRLNAQLAWRKLLLQVRFDSAAWVHSPEAGEHSPYVSPPGTGSPIDCPGAPSTMAYCVVQPNDARLKDRFVGPGFTLKRGAAPMGVAAFYLEKLSLSYSDKRFDATLGDFYVNFGRGLVLSIRKVDELGIDTTVTGGKFAFRLKEKHVELSGVALAGVTNVQNFDQARAQYIADPDDLIAAAHVDARLYDKVLLGAHAVFGKPACPTGANCDNQDLGYVLRPGAIVDAPKLTDWLGLYFEYARRQDQGSGKAKTGDAYYAAANVYTGLATWLLEFKRYDNYQPWNAANDPFKNLVYQQPPTLEMVTTQLSNNTDITAGRLRVDARVSPDLNVFFSGEAGVLHPSAFANNVLLDFSTGAEIRWNQGRSHFFPILQVRHENELSSTTVSSSPDQSGQIERLYNVQWDLTQVLGRGFSVETQGFVWFRRKIEGAGYDDWREGTVYLGARWRNKLVVSAGYEFTTAETESLNQHNFFNGQVLWNITPSTSIALFGGGNRPGLKCISGVCRVFPAFQGARLEFVLRL